MKTIFFLLCILLSTGFVQAAEDNTAFFDAVKVYSDKLMILNDFVEFSEFDMSEIKFVNDTVALPTDAQGQVIPQNPSTPSPSAPAASSLNGEAEVRALYTKIPQFFYTSLKNQIYYHKVPVTLYPTNSPAFAKPLKLYIKIKKIHLQPYLVQRNGTYQQPIRLRIYGQLKDKATDEILLKYYDAAEAQFTLGKEEAPQALKSITNQLMRDLAMYLKTKY